MKKIISLIISVLVVFTAIPMMTLSVSAAAVTVGDENVWCYIGTASGRSVSADTIYYKADVTDAANHKYATPAEALDAAFDDSVTLSNQIFLNQDITLNEVYTLSPNASSKKEYLFNINGFAITSNVTDSSAFIIDGSKVSDFKVFGGTPNTTKPSFSTASNEPFFSKGKSSPDWMVFNGTFNGNISTKSDNWIQFSSATINGNIVHANTSPILIRSSKIYGDINAKGLIQFGHNPNTYIQGNVTTSGRIQIVVSNVVIDGNINAVGDSEFALQVGSGATGCKIGGDVTLSGASTSRAAMQLDSAVEIGGQTTITGKSADATYTNCTFGKGLDNQTNAAITLDGTDKVGSKFYNENEFFDTTVTNFGASVTAPESAPVKDGFTFVGWTDESGELVDFDTAAPTQGFNNKYYAKFSSYTEKHIPVTTDDFYLPDANTLTRDGDKIVCYKDSKGNIASCGSLATNGETYDAITVNLNQLSGAQMRLNKITSGIRFLSEINTADINTFKDNSLNITEIGTKIAPEEYFSDSTKQDSDFLSVVAGGFYEENSEKSTIAGSIVRIKDKNLNRNFIGQGYVKVKLPNGDVETITAVLSNDQARSVYKIASIANQDSSLSAANKEIIASYLDSVVIINDGLITVPTGYETPYIYTGKKVIPNTTLTNTTANIRLVVLDSVNYYKDSDSAPLAAIITDDPNASDVTDLTIEEFNVNITAYDGKTDTEDAILVLPKTYTDNGAPTRLIIDCHGFSSDINGLKTAANAADGDTYKNLLYFAHQGYAVLAVQGGGRSHDAVYNLANSGAINGYVASYEYCLKNYNIAKDVFVKGSSMGGLVSQNLITSGRVPVLAYVGDSPVTSFYRQLYCESWDNNNIKNVAKMYNFDFSNTGYTYDTFPFTLQSKQISPEERQLFIDNFKDKVLPVNTIWKYCQFFDNDTKEFKAGYEDFLTATDPARVQELYSKIAIDFPVPYLICHASIDSSVSHDYSKYFVDAINRGNGAKAELKTYEVKQSAHCNLGDLTTYPCKDGSQFTAVSSFDEMLKFFRQYDK